MTSARVDAGQLGAQHVLPSWTRPHSNTSTGGAGRQGESVSPAGDSITLVGWVKVSAMSMESGAYCETWGLR